MNRNTPHCAQWVEVLEDRQFFSATAPVLMPARAHTPQIGGIFTGLGISKVSGNANISATLDVTRESKTGYLTGTISAKEMRKGSHSKALTFTGQISGTSFKLTLSSGVILSGTDANNVLTGTYRGGGDHGTFRFAQ